MTLKTVEEKVDDAVYAAFEALGLSVADNIDASVAMNEAITPIAEQLITDDDEDENEGEMTDPVFVTLGAMKSQAADPVVTYGIQVGRDATQFFSATVAGSLAEIKEKASRHGYQGETLDGWKKDGCDTFENVDVIHIYNPMSSEVVATWWPTEGWTEPDSE